MFTWDRASQLRRAATLTAAVDATFTPVEIAHLRVLRERYATSGEGWELGLDVRRLRFARWLVEQGRLSDDVDGV